MAHSFHCGSTRIGDRSLPGEMDHLLLERCGLGRVCISLAVCDPEMVSGGVNQPMVGVYGKDQLWTLFAPQDPTRYGAIVPLGPASRRGAADGTRCQLRYGNTFLEFTREAIPEAKAILRIQAGTTGRRE